MTKRPPPKWLQKKLDNRFGAIPWIELFIMLPEGGVEVAFPNIESCETRFAAVRWPEGVRCLSCGGKNIGHIENRALYQCRECRRQFSATAGTDAHRSRLNLRMWFLAAEEIITAHAEETEYYRLVTQAMAGRYNISYSATHRLKTALMKSLSQPGGGLIGACICMRELPVSRDPAMSPEEWYWMLRVAMQ